MEQVKKALAMNKKLTECSEDVIIMKDQIMQLINDVHRLNDKNTEYVEPQLRRMDNKISLLN